jgi:hypothetical protein
MPFSGWRLAVSALDDEEGGDGAGARLAVFRAALTHG